MKYAIATLLFFILNSDQKFDYGLLIGSWKQKSIAGTEHTGVFIFSADGNVKLEMRDGTTDQFMGGMDGPYRIEKDKNLLFISLAGREKQFEVKQLDDKTLVIHNASEGKDPQTFARYNPE